jgi:GT2 family glycosyltransferase
MADISIIIVSWNAKDFLKKCIHSILEDTNKFNIEIIVVDNASSDGSPAMVASQFPEVKIICNEGNLGFAKANNIGMKQSSGKYVFLINSDIEILHGCFESMISFMEVNPDIGMLGPRILNPDRTLQPSCRGCKTLWNMFCRAASLDMLFPKMKIFGGREMAFWPHDTIRDVEELSGCFWMVTRKALDEVGLLDEDFFIYSEDSDWCKRFQKAGTRIVFSPEAQAIHYGGASSNNAPVRFAIEMNRANLHYWKKHHSRMSQTGFLLITAFHHFIRCFGETIKYIIRPSQRKQIAPKIKKNLACVRWLLSFNHEAVKKHDY